MTNNTTARLARQTVTHEGAARLRQLMAYGPLAAHPADVALASLGFVESYDGSDSVDLVGACYSTDGRCWLGVWLALEYTVKG